MQRGEDPPLRSPLEDVNQEQDNKAPSPGVAEPPPPSPALAGEGGGGFALVSPLPGLSAAAFGRLKELGPGMQVTDVTVGNWIRKGLPAVKGPDDAWIIDKAAGLAWYDANRRERRRGGVREGSGKKRADGSSGGGGTVVVGGELPGQGGGQSDEYRKQQERDANDRVVTFLKSVPADAPDFAARAFEWGLKAAEVDRISALTLAQKQQMEMAQKRRELVSVTDAGAEWKRLIDAACSLLDAMPLRAAEAAVARAGGDVSLVPIIAAVLDGEVRAVKAAIGEAA